MEMRLLKRPVPLLPGQEITSKNHVVYRVGREIGGGTLHRAVPKAKGKRARKLDKLRRRLARAS